MPDGAKIPYGCEQFGSLTTVILHRPGRELELINHENYLMWLFDSVPDIAGFINEHDRYRELLLSLGVDVLELSDYVTKHRALISERPNLTYLHDTAVICRKGAIISSMAWEGRKNEHLVVREAMTSLGIPIFIEFDDPHDVFEGCLLLSPETVLVVETERHRRVSIEKFIQKALTFFSEAVWIDIPKARRYMHPDTILIG
ncbi:MAG: arginine deiminase family protein [bacterium]